MSAFSTQLGPNKLNPILLSFPECSATRIPLKGNKRSVYFLDTIYYRCPRKQTTELLRFR